MLEDDKGKADCEEMSLGVPYRPFVIIRKGDIARYW